MCPLVLAQYPIVREKYQTFVVENRMSETEFFQMFYKSLVFRRTRLVKQGDTAPANSGDNLRQSRTVAEFFEVRSRQASRSFGGPRVPPSD